MSLIVPSGVGCSFLVHLFAQHPKLIAAIGLAGAIGLISPNALGPGTPAGTARTLQGAEKDFSQALSPDIIAKIEQKTAVASGADAVLDDVAVVYVLDKCNCGDWTVRDIQENPELRSLVAKLYFLDLVNRYGLTRAEEFVRTQKTARRR